MGIYFFPSNSKKYSIDAYSWVRESDKNLDADLFLVMKEWLYKYWPFEKSVISISPRGGREDTAIQLRISLPEVYEINPQPAVEK